MKLYLISQTVNQGYDTFDSAVVAARTPEQAKHIVPGSEWTWASPDAVIVDCIGTAAVGTKAGVICASFNAG